jgi:archaellum biogenesis protein FlaJ (TadC family)
MKKLKQNIEFEGKLVGEIIKFDSDIKEIERTGGRGEERRILASTLNSLLEQLKIINNSIPNIIDSITVFKKLEETRPVKKAKKEERLVEVKSEKIKGKPITLEKAERTKFMKELDLSQRTLKKLKKKRKEEGEVEKEEEKDVFEMRKVGMLARTSNKIFFNLSKKYIKKGYFDKLEDSLRKANMPYLLTTYVSMSFFLTLVSLILALIIVTITFLINPVTALMFSAAVILLPIFTFITVYYYPYLESKSLGGKIDQEIPFVAIHMSAVAGSGIEPSQIFNIIALGEEYPSTKTEVRKIITQVNVYGYDIVTALKNTAKETSSKKLSELLNGIASTITEGGSLADFFNKRAETLLFEYKLEREKSTKAAETFMDIYISIMIMAPMLMMMLLILISWMNISIGISMNMLTLLIIMAVSLINIIFLAVLQVRQRGY